MKTVVLFSFLCLASTIPIEVEAIGYSNIMQLINLIFSLFSSKFMRFTERQLTIEFAENSFVANPIKMPDKDIEVDELNSYYDLIFNYACYSYENENLLPAVDQCGTTLSPASVGNLTQCTHFRMQWTRLTMSHKPGCKKLYPYADFSVPGYLLLTEDQYQYYYYRMLSMNYAYFAVPKDAIDGKPTWFPSVKEYIDNTAKFSEDSANVRIPNIGLISEKFSRFKPSNFIPSLLAEIPVYTKGNGKKLKKLGSQYIISDSGTDNCQECVALMW